MTTRLTAGQAARYAEWIANQRELRRLIAEMEQISRQEAFRMIHCSSSPKTTGVARRNPDGLYRDRARLNARAYL